MKHTDLPFGKKSKYFSQYLDSHPVDSGKYANGLYHPDWSKVVDAYLSDYIIEMPEVQNFDTLALRIPYLSVKYIDDDEDDDDYAPAAILQEITLIEYKSPESDEHVGRVKNSEEFNAAFNRLYRSIPALDFLNLYLEGADSVTSCFQAISEHFYDLQIGYWLCDQDTFYVIDYILSLDQGFDRINALILANDSANMTPEIMNHLERCAWLKKLAGRDAVLDFIIKVGGHLVNWAFRNNLIIQCEKCGKPFEYCRNKKYCCGGCRKSAANSRNYIANQETRKKKYKISMREDRELYKKYGIKPTEK